MTLALPLRLVLAAVLLGAATLKVRAGRDGPTALRSFGIGRPSVQAAAWCLIAATEALLAVGIALGMRAAGPAAAATMLLFAAAIALALARGRAGMRCGCFGARSRLSRLGLARTLLLAGAFASLPWLAAVRPGSQAWLELGLAIALAGVVALAAAVLALAREVGELRLSLPPQAALSLPHEGPEVGSRVALIDEFGELQTQLALAVFLSAACRLCDAVRPALGLVGNDPHVTLRVFDEERDAHAWRSLDVPGSPYAVVLSEAGAVLAKGTFNTLPQLEGILAEAERRAVLEPVGAGASTR